MLTYADICSAVVAARESFSAFVAARESSETFSAGVANRKEAEGLGFRQVSAGSPHQTREPLLCVCVSECVCVCARACASRGALSK